MKTFTTIFIIVMLIASPTLKSQDLETGHVSSQIGDIHYRFQKVEGTTPLVLLHGVYYDHHLWDEISPSFRDRSVLVIDMPMHGQSKHAIQADWSMNDVVQMLIEVLDSLGIERCYSVGHSWGSMSILRAAAQHPERFVAVGFGNMPIDAGTKARKRAFAMQHTMLTFRGFYAKQAAKSLYGDGLKDHPEWTDKLEQSMKKLKSKEVKHTDKAVITHVDDSRPFIERLAVPALGLVGKEDYVTVSPKIDTRVVSGGHVTPIEAPEAFIQFIKDVIKLAS